MKNFTGIQKNAKLVNMARINGSFVQTKLGNKLGNKFGNKLGKKLDKNFGKNLC